MYGTFRFILQEYEHQHEIKTPIYVVNTYTGEKTLCDAIWDTGATGSMISESVASKLNLRPMGRTTIAGVHGVHDANSYIVDIKFDNGALLRSIKVTEASNTGGFGLLVGMDIIGKGILCVDGVGDALNVRFELNAELQSF